jgi:hypothetical protein
MGVLIEVLRGSKKAVSIAYILDLSALTGSKAGNAAHQRR